VSGPPARSAGRAGAAPRGPAPVAGQITVLIEGTELPGRSCAPEPDGTAHANVHVAVYSHSRDHASLPMPGSPWLATEPVPGDAAGARWLVPVTVRRGPDGFDFTGPFVRGGRDDRHLGLAWGDVTGDGTMELFRGAKLRFAGVDAALIEAALRPGQRLVARVRLTDDRGLPVCARLRPSHLAWSVEPEPAGR
jgi:hypothetical protein